MGIDWSWWPYLEIPFPFMDEPATLDLTILDTFLHGAGAVVGGLLVFVVVFLIVRRLLVSFSGGD